MKNHVLVALTLACTTCMIPVCAQQEIKDKNGNSFMSEEVPGGQQIKTEGGGLFMEEVPQKTKPKKAAPKPEIDFGSLGVPVDPKGRIVPLIQPGSGPVLQNSSRLEVEYTPPTIYVPYSNYYRPGPMPYLSPLPYPNYGYGYGSPYANPYYRPYRPYSPQSPFSTVSPFGTPPIGGNPFNYGPYPYSVPFPYGGIPNPFYAPTYSNLPQYSGAFAVPLGMPSYFSSSSDDPAENQQANYRFSGSYWNGLPSASIWSPGWRSPFGGSLFIPQITQFQQQGSVRAIFPKSLDGTDSDSSSSSSPKSSDSSSSSSSSK